MSALESTRHTGAAGVAAGQTVLLALAVCEAIALDAIGDPVQRSGVALQARRLRARSEDALELSTVAYAHAREQLELAAVGARQGGDAATGRDAALRRALIDAADSLIALAEAAADAVVLAAELMQIAEPSRRPDAAGMAELSLGVARCVQHLVEVNLALKRGDERRAHVSELVAAAERVAAAARMGIGED